MSHQTRRVGGAVGMYPGAPGPIKKTRNGSLRKQHFNWNLKDKSEGYVQLAKIDVPFLKRPTFFIYIDPIYAIIHTGVISRVFNELNIANLVSTFPTINKKVRAPAGHSLSWNCSCCSKKKMIHWGSGVLWLSFLEAAKWCTDYVSKKMQGKSMSLLGYYSMHALFFTAVICMH